MGEVSFMWTEGSGSEALYVAAYTATAFYQTEKLSTITALRKFP